MKIDTIKTVATTVVLAAGLFAMTMLEKEVVEYEYTDLNGNQGIAYKCEETEGTFVCLDKDGFKIQVTKYKMK